MNMPAPQRFDTRAAFQEALRAVVARAQVSLDLFDPDFSLFGLGAIEIGGELRRFLRGGGRLQLVMHTPAWLEREAPRFLRLLRDYEHAVECRVTPRGLRELTDSFCIADDLHLVRRFHSDHLRGEMALDMPQETDVPRARFEAIWRESQPGLHATVTGL